MKILSLYRVGKTGFLVFLMLTLLPSLISAQEETIKRELLLVQDIPIVVTAAKRTQPITEAPSAISVITAEDIKQSGATQLGEVLMMTPGVYFGYTTSNGMTAGGIRGFNKMPINKVVLLIDGMPCNHELYALPSLDIFPISLEEIERVEVLRGPGSSLYGADAMFGVINVITKKLEDTKGNLISFTGGEQNTLIGTYIHGGSTLDDKIDYRVSLGWEQRDNWGYIAHCSDPVSKLAKVNTTIDYNVDDNSKINLSGSYVDVKKYYNVQPGMGPVEMRDDNSCGASITYTSEVPNLMLRTYWHEEDMLDSGWALGMRLLNCKMGTKAVEFQHTWEPLDKDVLVWGANFAQLSGEGPIIEGKHKHDTSGIFVDNTYKLKDNLSLNTGLRYDHHPNTGGTFSHRVALLHSPYEDHHLRFTWASSYRNPDFIETYSHVKSPPMPYISLGREENKAEKAETFEVGYQGMLTKKLSLETNVFYTEAADFIYFIVTSINPATLVPTFEYVNIENAEQLGAEIELKYPFTDWLSGVLNYTYFEQWEDALITRELLTMTPQHMCNAQLRAKFKNGFSSNLSLHYRDSTDWTTYIWPDPQGMTIAGGKAGDYLIANLRLGYEFMLLNKDAEIALAVFNLLDEKYDDYPLDTCDVGRRITGTFTCKF